MAEIVFEFDTDGTCTTKVNGVKGKSCKDLTKSFEKALGTVVEDKKTPEFYEAETNGVQLRRG